MSEDRKKPGWAFWTIVVMVVVLLGYPFSLGPAVWLTGRRYLRESTVSSFYWPVLWSTAHAQSLEHGVDWWGSLWAPAGEFVTLQIVTEEANIIFQFGDPLTPDPGGVM
ncbi:MAG TPA: hypothetical protein VGM05_22685 [Planctomycetaceae bacterium]|jgi:hypothetical protein